MDTLIERSAGSGTPLPLLRLRTLPDPPTQRVEVEGELDASTVELLIDAICALTRTEVERIDLSLRGLDFFGACGITGLLRIRKLVATQGKQLTLTAVSPITRRVLDLACAAGAFDLDGAGSPSAWCSVAVGPDPLPAMG